MNSYKEVLNDGGTQEKSVQRKTEQETFQCLEAERPGSGKVPQVRGVHDASQSLRQLRILQWTGCSEERGLISTFRGGIEKERSFSIFLYKGKEAP